MTTASAAEPVGGQRSGLYLGVAVWWCAVLVLTSFAVRLVLDLRGAGLPNDGTSDMVASVVAAVGGSAVAASIVLRAPANPVGWLLLGLFTMFALDGVASYYPGWAAHRGWSGAGAVAGLEQPTWAVELALLGAAMLLVPTGTLPGRRWRYVAWAGLVSVPLTYLAVLVVPDGPFTGPSAGLADPFAVSSLDSTTGHVLRAIFAITTELLVVACMVSLVVRFRSGDSTVRRQLSWVMLGATTVPVFVVALFVTHVLSGAQGTATIFVESAGFDVMLLAIPLSIALAMARYRLYSVDEVVDSAMAWLVASGILLLALTGAVLIIGLFAGSRAQRSPLAVAVATGVAVLAARPLHRVVQRVVNRRFHRRSFDAVRAVDAYVERLRRGEASLDELEPVLRGALGDSSLIVTVPVDDDLWVRPDGSSAGVIVDPDHTYTVSHGGSDVGRVTTLVLAADDRALRDAGRAAALALENARLRAQAVVQLAEVRASRQRIVAAQYDERRRLERDLHDGAQQRLMAAIMALTSARRTLPADEDVLALVDQASAEVSAAVKDVRALAHGLHPAVLAEEGLVAALESVGDRAPAAVAVDIAPGVAEGLTDEQAATMYFGVCECLTNAVRHGGTAVGIRGFRSSDTMRFEVSDNGPGGAWLRPGGGLSGLLDRFQAGDGAVEITSDEGRGTTVSLVLPCSAS